MADRPKHYGQWGQRGKLPQEKQRKGCCRWCGDPIPEGSRRYSYCSAECYQDMWLRISWGTMRNHIIARDKTCRICEAWSWKPSGGRGNWSCCRTVDGAVVRYTRLELDWHVDHITPVSEGGTDDPANLRLLCGACHKRVTKEWHGERAAARRPQMQLLH